MFGLMGLTRLRGGMKKGPLFPRLLRCALTYFWEAAADHGGPGVDRGGHGGGTSQLPVVCVWGMHSLAWAGGGRSCQAAGTTLQPQKHFQGLAVWPQASAALLGLSFPFCQGGSLG